MAACQKGETHKMHFKGMNVMKNELNCKATTRRHENCTCSTTHKKIIRNWMPLKCLMSSKISGASMHFCLWFIPFFVCFVRSHACENISGVFMLLLFLPRSFMFEFFPLLLVESCCAYFHCDSIQSSRFAWFHSTFRNFLHGNRIPLARDENSQDVWYQHFNSKC